MRFLELLVIATSSIQLGILVFKLFKSERLIKTIPFIGLIPFMIHLIIEGYRIQMLPAYLVVILLSLNFIVKRKASKTIFISKSIGYLFLLVLAILLPTAIPVLQFKNKGKHKVGVRMIQLKDSQRPEILTKDTTDYRDITVRLFYPTPDDKNEIVSYFSNFDLLKSIYKKKMGWPPFLMDYLRLFNIEAIENGNIKTTEKFPLLIYSHGMGNNFFEATGRMMHLASRGYIVAAINHTYKSDFGILSDGKPVGFIRTTYYNDPLERTDSAKSVIANQWVADAGSVINYLTKREIKKTINFENVGLLGFSAGGTMSSLGSFKIDKIKAVINLDGTPRGLNHNYNASCPQLMMVTEPTYYSDAQLKAWGMTKKEFDAPLFLKEERMKKLLQNTSHPSYFVRIPNTKHSNFVEFPLISPYSKHLRIGGSIESWKCYNMINEMILTFLDNSMKGENNKFPKFEGVVVLKNE